MSAFDADFVAQVVEVPVLREHLEPGWREHLSVGGGLAGAGYNLPAAPYRMDVRGDIDHDARARELLDARDVACAIATPGNAARLSGIANAVMAAELARACNDWMLEHWPAVDDRLRVSLVVSARDGRLAAEEIMRHRGDPRVAQVVLAFPPSLLGDRALYPVFEAAQDAGLPVCLQAGGGFVGVNPGPSPTGHPTSRWEYAISSGYGGIAHLLSVVSEGVFTRFPQLRLVLSGFGIAWLPSLLWRMDGEFEAGGALPRRLDRRPSDVVREHVAFTTVGLERPGDPGQLSALLEAIGGQSLLLLGSGDSSDPRPWPLDAFGADLLLDNARRIYPVVGPAKG